MTSGKISTTTMRGITMQELDLRIPEGMPTLSSGAHAGPEDGACIMEYAALISGDTWSDTPMCTSIGLAFMAQAANDYMNDKGSQEKYLLPLLPRIMGTSDEHVHVENRALVCRQMIWDLAKQYNMPLKFTTDRLFAAETSEHDYWDVVLSDGTVAERTMPGGTYTLAEMFRQVLLVVSREGYRDRLLESGHVPELTEEENPYVPGADEQIARALEFALDRYEVRMGDIGEPVRRIEVVPVPEPAEAPVKEPSPSVTPEREPVPA